MASELTPNQIDAMRTLSQYVGQTVEVLTSGYTANVAPSAIANAVGTFKSSALRGLEAKGFIRIDRAYWKGARVTVLKGLRRMTTYTHNRPLDTKVTEKMATERPYKAEKRNGYWIVVDSRSGEHVSYPTSQSNARAEAAIMNRAYAEAVSA